MERSSKAYMLDSTSDWEELGGGVSRKILGFDNQIMMVRVRFEKGALGSPHQHFHTQATYVVSGRFQFEIDGLKCEVVGGDGVYIEPNLLHSAICLEAGELIDVFSPVREDFLSGAKVSYFGNSEE